MPVADDVHDAPVIVSSTPGSFARGVLAERHPALIQKVRDAFPWSPDRHRSLDALLHSCTRGVIEPLDADAHDREQWDDWGGRYFGQSWFDVPFLWAESYFYRRLLAATGYFAPGPWQGVDPFAPFKRAELRSPLVDEELAALDPLAPRPVDERAAAFLRASLWGNRADLGFRVGSPDAPGEDPGDDSPLDSRLVADDSALLKRLLSADSAASAAVHLVADNSGRELIPDLVLIDHILTSGSGSGSSSGSGSGSDSGPERQVVLHVKPYPYYVSDATMADVIDCVRRLAEAPGAAGETGKRLWAALGDGRLAVRTHGFFCAPFPYSAMPDDLRQQFSKAAVTIVKGDLNYRRLVGDRLWPATTSFAGRTAYFPGPVAALRTLKSDVIVGLDPRTLARLERGGSGNGNGDGNGNGAAWRTSGTHALIQARP